MGIKLHYYYLRLTSELPTRKESRSVDRSTYMTNPESRCWGITALSLSHTLRLIDV